MLWFPWIISSGRSQWERNLVRVTIQTADVGEVPGNDSSPPLLSVLVFHVMFEFDS